MIADTSLLVAVANERDVHHEHALRRFESTETWHVHEYVFVETVTVVAARCVRDAAVTFGRFLLEDDRFRWRPAAGGLEGAWRVFQDEDGLSLTDAALVAWSRESGMDVATYDQRLAAACA